MDADSGNICLKNEEWEADFSTSDSSLMSFSYKGTELLRLNPVSFSPAVTESVGITRLLRTHKSLNGLAWAVDSESVIPFGAEPEISRVIEFAGNHAKIVTDIKTVRGFSGNELSAGNVFLPGKWEKAGILEFPGQASEMPAVKWVELEGDTVIFDYVRPFAAVILEGADGIQIEVGTGDDIWRWVAGLPFGAESRFRIENSPTGVHITRHIALWPEKTEFPVRNWRVKWYFAWGNSSDISEAPATALDPYKIKWPDGAKAVFKGDIRRNICFNAHVTQKRIKKLIRTEMASGNGIMALSDIAPCFCEASRHTGKAHREPVPHWDIMKIMDIWLWGMKQLKRKGRRLCFYTPENSVFSVLPSMRGLSRGLSDTDN
jgi:hypothetical protein